VTSGTLYYSLALKVAQQGTLSSTGGTIAGVNNSRGTQPNTPTVFGNRILTRAAGSDGFNLGVAKNSTNAADWVWATNTFRSGDTVFLVGSYTFNGGSATDDVATLWIDPNPYEFGTETPPPPTLTANTGADITANQIASFVFLQQGLNDTNQPQTAIADELRIGPTWASVTPPGVIRPLLAIDRVGSKAVLSWSTNAVGFILEASGNLTGPSGWTNVGPHVISGNLCIVTNDLFATPVFYRLRSPQ
jgi:hypothetical protein